MVTSIFLIIIAVVFCVVVFIAGNDGQGDTW